MWREQKVELILPWIVTPSVVILNWITYHIETDKWSTKTAPVKPHKKDKILIDYINDFINTGLYELNDLYSDWDLVIYTEDSLRALANDFNYYYSWKGLSIAKRRKGSAKLNMKAFMKSALNNKKDWWTNLTKNVIYENWEDVNKQYILDNKITSGSSKFYKEQMRDKLTREQKLRLNEAIQIINIPWNDATIHSILHWDKLF